MHQNRCDLQRWLSMQHNRVQDSEADVRNILWLKTRRHSKFLLHFLFRKNNTLHGRSPVGTTRHSERRRPPGVPFLYTSRSLGMAHCRYREGAFELANDIGLRMTRKKEGNDRLSLNFESTCFNNPAQGTKILLPLAVRLNIIPPTELAKRQGLTQQLLRYCLTVDREWYYSFCEGVMVKSSDTWHFFWSY
jgi:hypothetical protein